ncbi:hypothetical protein [Allostreptomyces psammosilenae]|uniref:Uncharacterized protein n=1 Tax=Allostreptomyces psammosilenae TaxID=1892865 RepID=A0A853ACV9_9ACTN|nr:hypothetical protein [Allostreptomyces psammosilenae]NYI08278.1 hypothetical protein [Allostreptomyces psammosilenae]
MSLLTTLARAQAVREDRAQPLATVRHRHLAAEPLVLVPLSLAGEASTPLAVAVGTDPAVPRVLVVADPLDREHRDAFFAELAEVVLPHLERFEDATETEEARAGQEEPAEVCVDAPQILVPNAAGLAELRLFGRALRFRRTVPEDSEAPTAGGMVPHPSGGGGATPEDGMPRVALLGRWLTHYGERSMVPGSSLLLAMTDVLARHWATGQSATEDQHLGALLAWIEAAARGTGGAAAAARRAEVGRDEEGLLVSPPAGPATDPVFDTRVLAPLLERYRRLRAEAEDPAARGGRGANRAAARRVAGEIRRAVERQLLPTWHDVWRGVELLRTLPEAARVPQRWRGDRWSFTLHRDAVRAGEPPQPRQDDPVRATRRLRQWERALTALAAQEAADDPLVLAERRLAGEALVGEVVGVEMVWTEGKRPRPRPLLTVRTEDGAEAMEEGESAHRWGGPVRQKAEVAEGRRADGTVVLRLVGGMGTGREPAEGSVPAVGEQVVFALADPDGGGGRSSELPAPEEIPWTHGGPRSATGAEALDGARGGRSGVGADAAGPGPAGVTGTTAPVNPVDPVDPVAPASVTGAPGDANDASGPSDVGGGARTEAGA